MITKLPSAPKVECYIMLWRIFTTHNTVFQDDLLSNTSLHSNPQVIGKKLSFSMWLFHFSTTDTVEILKKKNILQGWDRNKWKWKKPQKFHTMFTKIPQEMGQESVAERRRWTSSYKHKDKQQITSCKTQYLGQSMK